MLVAAGQPCSLLTHEPGTDEADQQRKESVLFLTLRELNLATWALCACDSFAADVFFRKGMMVRMRDLRKRTDLNGREGTVLGREPRVAGRTPRWRVEVDGCVVAARALNMHI